MARVDGQIGLLRTEFIIRLQMLVNNIDPDCNAVVLPISRYLGELIKETQVYHVDLYTWERGGDLGAL